MSMSKNPFCLTCRCAEVLKWKLLNFMRQMDTNFSWEEIWRFLALVAKMNQTCSIRWFCLRYWSDDRNELRSKTDKHRMNTLWEIFQWKASDGVGVMGMQWIKKEAILLRGISSNFFERIRVLNQKRMSVIAWCSCSSTTRIHAEHGNFIWWKEDRFLPQFCQYNRWCLAFWEAMLVQVGVVKRQASSMLLDKTRTRFIVHLEGVQPFWRACSRLSILRWTHSSTANSAGTGMRSSSPSEQMCSVSGFLSNDRYIEFNGTFEG